MVEQSKNESYISAGGFEVLISDKDLDRIRRRQLKIDEECKQINDNKDQHEAELDDYVKMIERVLGNPSVPQTKSSSSSVNDS